MWAHSSSRSRAVHHEWCIHSVSETKHNANRNPSNWYYRFTRSRVLEWDVQGGQEKGGGEQVQLDRPEEGKQTLDRIPAGKANMGGPTNGCKLDCTKWTWRFVLFVRPAETSSRWGIQRATPRTNTVMGEQQDTEEETYPEKSNHKLYFNVLYFI